MELDISINILIWQLQMDLVRHNLKAQFPVERTQEPIRRWIPVCGFGQQRQMLLLSFRDAPSRILPAWLVYESISYT